jgi:hypothetical protein
MKILKGKPVITLLGVRNMWAMAQEKVKARISQAGGIWIGNIVLTDPHPNLVSVITIVRWMMTADKYGKGLYAKLFPPAGVPDLTIKNAKKFGEIILEATKKDQLTNLQEELLLSKAVTVNPVLIKIEKRAKIMFNILARWILKKGDYNDTSRVGRLKVFKYYLFTVIYLVSPMAAAIFWTLNQLSPRAVERLITYYSGVE